jgi:hypothetical protein
VLRNRGTMSLAMVAEALPKMLTPPGVTGVGPDAHADGAVAIEFQTGQRAVGDLGAVAIGCFGGHPPDLEITILRAGELSPVGRELAALVTTVHSMA